MSAKSHFQIVDAKTELSRLRIKCEQIEARAAKQRYRQQWRHYFSSCEQMADCNAAISELGSSNVLTKPPA